MTFNAIDAVVLVVLALSAGLALMRGFVREILSIACWIAATVVTLLALPAIRPVLAPALGIVWLADILGGAVVFIATLIVLTLLTHLLVKTVKASPLSPLDRGLGMLFGVARGVLILALVYMAYSWVVPEDDQPPVVRNATTQPYVLTSAAVLQSLLPPDWLEQGRTMIEDTAEGAGSYDPESNEQMQELLQQLD